MTLLTSLLHVTNFRNPFLRTLVPSITLAYGIQAAVAIPSIAAQTERFYDLSGSITYISCAALSLYLPTLRSRAAAAALGGVKPAWPSLLAAFSRSGAAAGANAFNWRQVVLTTAVTIWATRLGSFLFQRITADDGRDSRFEKIRGSPPKFTVAFFAQATWVSLCLLPILAINALPATTFAALGTIGITDVLGVLLWLGGFGFEITADRQKSQWAKEKKEKKHNEQFLTRGLWSKSRHPNYFGESTLWTGLATLSAGVLASKAGVAGMGLSAGLLSGKIIALAMSAVSPAFVTFLLLKVSGVPMSEKKYDKRFADNKDYQKWKRETPMFIPKF